MAGNVAPNTITTVKTKIANLKSVTNVNPGVGGVDAETIDHAVRFGPLAFRAGRRAVTLNDYVALAQQAGGGVAKVRAVSRSWNRIDLYVAPQGTTVTPAPAALKQKLVAFFDDKRMVGTTVFINDPVPLPLRVDVEIWVEHNYNADFVTQAVRSAVQDLFSFDNMDFAKTLYISKIYEAVESIPGVEAANVGTFRIDRPQPKVLLVKLTQVLPDGRIIAGDFEIPTLSTLNITVGGQLSDIQTLRAAL